MMSASPSSISSFRDPAGSVVQSGGRIFRIVRSSGLANASAFFGSDAIKQFVKKGSVVRTWKASRADIAGALGYAELCKEEAEKSLFLEHERVPFPSFPHEWPAEMLHAAGMLTLEICDRLLDEGNCLKDATPYNILFRGPKPVLVDVLSVEYRDPQDPVWLPYSQFMTSFLLPLLANREFGLTLDQAFLTRRDGFKPEELYKFCGALQRFQPSLFLHIVLPTWLGRSAKATDEKLYKKRPNADPEQAAFMMRRLIAGLRRKLEAVAPSGNAESTWSSYEQHNSYSSEEGKRKREFIDEVLQRTRPEMVLDVGSNAGLFSRLAAQRGSTVVAIDNDPVVGGRTFRHAQRNSLNILPLVINISRPTPSVGWNNSECSSFLERATRRFDAVLMLAVIHHLIVSERIPLSHIVSLLARLTKDIALVEYVSPDDPMFRKLARGRDALHAELTEDVFVSSFGQAFSFAEKVVVSKTRTLYLMRKTKP